MADFGGNRQYITTGNLRGSDRACLFLMDYPRRARLKNLRRRRGPGGRGPPAAAGAGGAGQLSRPH
ncbi:Flavodoxin reductases (ferredoxin-NADPH reductases) family 1 [Klebsiella pneumoniae IS53]|nr:Flavodoxin reductases (ferredoxin-NADPH reductases) family 1 [Klebsiella pneumoniae IS53]